MNKLVVGVIVAVVVFSAFTGYLVLKPAVKSTKIQIAGFILTVELAESPEEQRQGLSGRPNLPADHGMLFVFDHEEPWGFWMNEMLFPLDIIWFNSNREAVFFEPDLQPCNPEQCPVHVPTVSALYVLEVNANFTQTHNITIGTTFTFLN